MSDDARTARDLADTSSIHHDAIKRLIRACESLTRAISAMPGSPMNGPLVAAQRELAEARRLIEQMES